MFPDMPDRKEMGRYVALSQVGLEMIAPILVGLVVDHYLGWTKPWALVAGAVCGLCGGLIHLVHLLNKMDAKDSSQSDQESR
jgi:F0F1-type ATP synthase assembly protein I